MHPNTKTYFWLLALLALVVAEPARAADEFILRAEASYAREIASRFHLLLSHQINGQDVFLAQAPAGTPAEQLMQAIRNYDHGDNDADDDDDDDVLIEVNRVVALPEWETPYPRLITSSPGLHQALTDLTTRTYFGAAVRSTYVAQPAMTTIRAAEAHSSFGSGGGIVAVIDTGIDAEHPALARRVVSGFDFIRERPGIPSELDDLDAATRAILSPHTTAILDQLVEINPHTTAILDTSTATRLTSGSVPRGFGHGTMVAGLVLLVAPTARIMPLKAFGGDGLATVFHILRAIYFAESSGAKVINLSLSLASPSPELEKAVEFVSARGTICVASAGNQGQELVMYPAGYKQVAGVASTDLSDQRSSFSNHGDNSVMVAAPGEGLITTYPGGRYAAGWGTSFSAPLVAGAVALMIQLRPDLNWEKAQAALAEASPASGNLGSGRLDVYRAVRKASGL